MTARTNEIHAGYRSGPVLIRHPDMQDSDEFIEKARRSEELHKGLVAPPLNPADFSEYVKGSVSPTDRRFVILEMPSSELAGAINISQIFLKGFCSAYLGYYLFDGFTGRGLMTRALKAALAYAFEEVGLHRLEANIQPWNMGSKALVQRCGFTKEGYSPKYLKIGNVWRDHERWAIIKEDWIELNSDVG